ncbi:hypothetical protein LguiA_006404 [Lonicera macranthoides]
MAKCFSFSLTESMNWCYRSAFSSSGLRSTVTDLGDGTVMHCWVPKSPTQVKPNLVLIHGFGANAMWQWAHLIRRLVPHFNVYVPDLLFFGDSYTTRPERSDSFQAQCVMRVIMDHNSVKKMSLVGLSYGGFVAYRMAEQYKEAVERVVICCAGVCLEEKDLAEGLFPVEDVEEAANILLPQTPARMRMLMGYAFVRPPKVLPNCFMNDFINIMCREYVEEKKELLRALAKDRKLSDLPVIPQVSSIQYPMCILTIKFSRIELIVFSPDSTSSSRSLYYGDQNPLHLGMEWAMIPHKMNHRYGGSTPLEPGSSNRSNLESHKFTLLVCSSDKSLPPKLEVIGLDESHIRTNATFHLLLSKTGLLITHFLSCINKMLMPFMQPTLIVWGDRDQIFPLELGHRLKRHLGERAELAIIKGSGHAFIVEKPKETFKYLKSFLIDSVPSRTALPNHQNHNGL